MQGTRRLGWLALSAAFLASTAIAGTVTVEQGRGHLIVDARDATIVEILDQLRKIRPFDIERIGDISTSLKVTRRFEGEFRQIMNRVLENESHVLVTARSSPDIQTVVLYGTPATTRASATKPAPQPDAPPAAVTGTPAKEIDPYVQAAFDRIAKEAEAAKGLPAETAPPASLQPMTGQNMPSSSRQSAMISTGIRGRRGL